MASVVRDRHLLTINITLPVRPLLPSVVKQGDYQKQNSSLDESILILISIHRSHVRTVQRQVLLLPILDKIYWRQSPCLQASVLSKKMSLYMWSLQTVTCMNVGMPKQQKKRNSILCLDLSITAL